MRGRRRLLWKGTSIPVRGVVALPRVRVTVVFV
jgi:hypothetical protein